MYEDLRRCFEDDRFFLYENSDRLLLYRIEWGKSKFSYLVKVSFVFLYSFVSFEGEMED